MPVEIVYVLDLAYSEEKANLIPSLDGRKAANECSGRKAAL
jgi:hypothetical protein